VKRRAKSPLSQIASALQELVRNFGAPSGKRSKWLFAVNHQSCWKCDELPRAWHRKYKAPPNQQNASTATRGRILGKSLNHGTLLAAPEILRSRMFVKAKTFLWKAIPLLCQPKVEFFLRQSATLRDIFETAVIPKYSAAF